MKVGGGTLNIHQVQELSEGTGLKGAGRGDLKLDIPRRDVRLKDANLTGSITFGADIEKTTKEKLVGMFSMLSQKYRFQFEY